MEISVLVNKQREYFMKEVTLDSSFRRAALEKLVAAISEMELEIVAALAADLNKSKIEGYMTEIVAVRDEVKHTIKTFLDG